jgi:hypothetical protein
LDVSTSSTFDSYVPGYQNLDVGNVTNQDVTGLAANTFYYYRVRAYNGNGTSPNSNVVKVRTNNRNGTSPKSNVKATTKSGNFPSPNSNVIKAETKNR